MGAPGDGTWLDELTVTNDQVMPPQTYVVKVHLINPIGPLLRRNYSLPS